MANPNRGRKTLRHLCLAGLGLWMALACSSSDVQSEADAGSAGLSEAGAMSGSHAGLAGSTSAGNGTATDAGSNSDSGGSAPSEAGANQSDSEGGRVDSGGGGTDSTAGMSASGAGVSGTSAGSAGSSAGSAGANAGSAGANAGSAGASAGSAGASAGSAGASAGYAGASAGYAGASAGSTGASAGSTGASAGYAGASAGSGGLSASGGGTGGGGNGGGTAGMAAGGSCDAEPHACALGSCAPANPCHVGTLSCGDVPSCVDTLALLPAGTSCGAGSVCNASGTCNLVACQPLPANLPNCVADKPCHMGHCDASSPVCADLSALNLLSPAADGTACGVPNKVGVCAAGDCVVPHCLASGGACDIACVDSAGVGLAEGARCGVNSVCLTGKCRTELAVSAVPFTFVPGAPFCGVVGTVTDSNLADTTSTLVAKITWGDDGSTSAATISGSAGAFTVRGSHVFPISGTYNVSVTVTDIRTGSTTSSTFGVSDRIVEFALPSGSRPGAIVVGKDGNIWFGNNSSIARISPTGSGFTSFPVPNATTSGIPGITTSADDNLWFTVDRANQVGCITPQGIVTQFAVPTANSGPGGITAGADGNLWFLEDVGKIGRITSSGTITEFAVGALLSGSDSGPRSTDCLGPDGNVWFTAYVASEVGRITPEGAIMLWPTPTANSYPTGITTGPDGNLWFLELAADQIVRMTPNGVFTEFPTHNSSGTVDLSQISVGPDGNLWVVEYNSNRIAKVTTSGAITQFNVPTPNSQGGFIAPSASALWFNEGFAGKIGRLIP